jgi:hypothetical protein
LRDCVIARGATELWAGYYDLFADGEISLRLVSKSSLGWYDQESQHTQALAHSGVAFLALSPHEVLEACTMALQRTVVV